MGMREMQYSVSLPLTLHKTGPKPMEKRSTPTPESRATMKWPHSWMRMRMPRTATKATMVVIVPSSPRRREPCPVRAPRRSGALPRPRYTGLDAVERARGHAIERGGDQLRDLGVADAPFEKSADRHFVGRVQNGGSAARRGQSLAGEGQAREAIDIGLLEGERPVFVRSSRSPGHGRRSG
jgi:hypothetical protein